MLSVLRGTDDTIEVEDIFNSKQYKSTPIYDPLVNN